MRWIMLAATAAIGLAAMSANAADICQGFGPQTPRDISAHAGSNPRTFATAPASTEMNLCNIHFHVSAEHKGPGFSVSAGSGEHGGYRCNGSDSLTQAELAAVEGHGNVCHGVKPGDTIEVHWVHSSCAVTPGATLGACSTKACVNPQLRVESQVFLVINDASAAQFQDFAYGGNVVNDLHQAKALPSGSGAPVQFMGSTTGPSFDEATCSPYQVTWNVRPQCMKLDINSLNAWCGDNVFAEDHAHGVRQLVTSAALLAIIK